MWRILQADKPDTYVLATGRTETVRRFVEMSCLALNMEVAWEGQGEKEVGINTKTGQTIIKINPRYYRPAEVDLLIGNPAKAKAELGWEAKTSLEDLCAMMVNADIKRVEKGVSF